jgi:hypothetical protein
MDYEILLPGARWTDNPPSPGRVRPPDRSQVTITRLMSALRLLPLVLLLVSVACDDPEPPPAAPAPRKQELRSIELRSIAPLRIGPLTHFTCDTLGNIFWVQETSDQNDAVFAVAGTGVPRITALTSRSICAALGEKAGTGNIQSLVAVREELWFYFAGGTATRTLSCVGRFNHVTSQVEIMLDSDDLGTLTGMGLSLDLARGDLIRNGSQLHLWVRHLDAGTVLRIDPAATRETMARRLFDRVTAGALEISLETGPLMLSAGPEQSLLLLDPRHGMLFRVDPSGKAEPLWNLSGLPRRMARPLWDASGIMLFLAAADPMIATLREPPPLKDLPLTYPAILLLPPEGEPSTITTRAILLPRDMQHAQLELTAIIREPGRQTWITYDRGSGHLLRMRPVSVN